MDVKYLGYFNGKMPIAKPLCIFNTLNFFSFTFLGFKSEEQTILICIMESLMGESLSYSAK